MRRRSAHALVTALSATLLLSCGGDEGGSADPATRPPTSTVASTAPQSPGQTGPTTSTPGPRLTVPGDTGTTTATTTAVPAFDLRPNGPPPWSAGKISSGAAYRVGLDEWLVAENKDQARLVLPADVALSADATPRRANFSGGWAVAWDQTSGPGVEPSGAFCETCGRGVAGVAGTGSPASREFSGPFINVVRWSDGSTVGYTGPRADSRQFLANLYVNGQGRLYQVWSYISQRHLEYLISQLRFVEGAP